MKTKTIFTIVVLGLLSATLGGNVLAATATNGYILSAASLVNAQSITTGVNGQEQFACSIQKDFSGKLSVVKGPDSTELLSESELPGGYAFTSKFGCFGADGVYMISPHPTIKYNGVQAVTLFVKVGGVLSTLLDSTKTRFPFADPLAGNKLVTWTYNQAGGVDFRGNRAVVLVAATPDSPSGSPLATGISQLLTLEFDATKSVSPKVLFDTAVSLSGTTIKYSVSSMSAFCASNNGLYVTGKVYGQSASTTTAVALFRVSNGVATKIKDYFEPAKTPLACTADGAQVFNFTSGGGLTVSAFADNSSAEQVFFSATAVEGLTLTVSDTPYPVSGEELFLITSNHTLVYIGSNSSKLVKASTDAPKGTAFDITTIGKRPILLQMESYSQAYWLYHPQLTKTEYSARQGDALVLAGTDLVIEGVLPSVTLSGVTPDFSAATDGSLSFVVPADAEVGSVISGTVTVWGVALNFSVTVLASDALTAPTIKSVDSLPISPRSHFTVHHTSVRADREVADVNNPAYSLGNVSLTLDGVGVRLISSSPEELTALVPKTVLGKSQASLVLTLTADDGTTVSSAPFVVDLLPQADRLFVFDFAGVELPYLLAPSGAVVMQFMPARVGDQLTAFGTGCMVDPLPEDVDNPTDDLSAILPQVTVDGQNITADSAVMVGGQPGVCKYQFTVPQGVSSGVVKLSFATHPSVYNLFID